MLVFWADIFEAFNHLLSENNFFSDVVVGVSDKVVFSEQL